MSIHKKRRKVEICHNCHTILSLENNFCPHCGQENHDLKVPIGHLAFEVFEGFTHFDTKFYNTMRAIFTSPGKITKDFLEGRRGRYVPPVRLYFLIAFIFFFGLGSMVDLALVKGNSFLSGFSTGLINGGVVKIEYDNKKVKPKRELEKTLKNAQQKVLSIQKSKDTVGLFKAKEEVNEAELALKLYNKVTKKTNNWLKVTSVSVDEILDEMNVNQSDTLRTLIENLPEEKQRLRLIDIQKQIILDTLNSEPVEEINNQIRDYFTEVIGKKRQLAYSLNLYSLKNNASVKINYDGDTIITIKGSNGSIQNTAYLRKVMLMNNEQLDSLNKKRSFNLLGIDFLTRGFMKNFTYYQSVFGEDATKASSELAHLFVNVFSIMMFILMPIVALLLKIIYSKSSHSIIFYPIRLIVYLWDKLLFLVGFRKVRKHKRIPHLMFGQTKYYYEHLIFSIHIHAVLFLFLIIFVGGGIALGFWKYALIGTFLVFIVYSIIALKTVYRQGIFKTLFKSVILFFLYFISFMTVLTITSAIKFALS